MFLNRYYPDAITSATISILEDTPDVTVYLRENPHLIRKIYDDSTSRNTCVDIYRIDVMNFQILKMLHESYSIVESRHIMLHYHRAISNDRLDVIKWLWDLGVTFLTKNTTEHALRILEACLITVLDVSNKTIDWLMEKPSFAEFIRESFLIVDPRFKNVTHPTHLIHRLRLMKNCGIRVENLEELVKNYSSIAVKITLLNQVPEKFSYTIDHIKTHISWLFTLKYMHHHKKISYPDCQYISWIPNKYRTTQMDTVLFFCAMLVHGITTEMKNNSYTSWYTSIRWYFYNIFSPYVSRIFPSSNIGDRIRIAIMSQDCTNRLLLHQQFFPIIVSLLENNTSNYGFLVKELVVYLSRYAILIESRELLEYYATNQYFNYYTTMSFAIRANNESMIDILIDMKPELQYYLSGYLNSMMVRDCEYSNNAKELFHKLSSEDKHERYHKLSLTYFDFVVHSE